MSGQGVSARSELYGYMQASVEGATEAVGLPALDNAAPLELPPILRKVRAASARFFGRSGELADMVAWLERQPDSTVSIMGISGPDGIGKSELAARFLLTVADRFPGGQVRVDLSAPTGVPSRTGEVLASLLRAFRSRYLPVGVDEQAAWWRSLTGADPRRPMALLVDSAQLAGQVRPLLPGGSGHLVVVTSRDPLPGLVLSGARLMPLEPLPAEAARELLGCCIGPEHLAREPEAAQRLVALSAGMPLALTVTAAQLATACDAPLARMADHLTRQAADTTTFTRLHLPGDPVTSAIENVYGALEPQAARVYRHLALMPSPTLDIDLVSAACDITTDAAEQLLRRFAATQLLEELDALSERGPVFRFHGAVRAHAYARAQQEDQGAAEEVLRRVADWYLAWTTAAERLLTPNHRETVRDYAFPHPDARFASEASALAWLDENHNGLLATVHATSAAAMHGSTWQLVHAMWPWWHRRAEHSAWIEAHSLALAAVRQCADPLAELEIVNTLGVGLRSAGQTDTAIGRFNEVLHLARAADDRLGIAQALHELGVTFHLTGGDAQAQAYLIQARDLRREVGYVRGAALSELSLGMVAYDQGAYEQASELLTSAHTTLVQEQDSFDAARALAWLGRARAAIGDYGAAEKYLRRAHVFFKDAGSPRWIGMSLELLGHTAHDQQHHQEAAALYDQAMVIYRTVSPRDSERLRTSRPV